MDSHYYSLANGDSQTNGQSESFPLYEYWSRDDDVQLSHRDVEDINSAAFASAERTSNNRADVHQTNLNVGENDGCTNSSGSGSGAPTVSRRRKKPKGCPKRPLSGYNIFFREERVTVLQEFSSHRAADIADDVHAFDTKIDRSSVSFQDLGKIIGKRWKTLSEDDRRKFENLADQDNLRYRSEMDVYNSAKRKRNEEKSQLATVDDIDDTKQSTTGSSTWSTMILSRPSDIPVYSSLQPFATSAVPMTGAKQISEQTWPTTEQEQNAFCYPIPPGTELILPDQRGIDRHYQVQYNFYKMTRRDAESYMTELARTPSVTPYGYTDHPPPPPGSTHVPHPYWYG